MNTESINASQVNKNDTVVFPGRTRPTEVLWVSQSPAVPGLIQFALSSGRGCAVASVDAASVVQRVIA